MKDYYDIYFFLTKLKNEIDENVFIKALNNTTVKRNSLDALEDFRQILHDVQIDDRINKNWISYRKKNKYSESKKT